MRGSVLFACQIVGARSILIVRVAYNEDINIIIVGTVERSVTGHNSGLRYRLLLFELRVVRCCVEELKK